MVHCATANEVNSEKQNQTQILYCNLLDYAAAQMIPGKKPECFNFC